MAINPETQYPGKITASSLDYPYGEARNITAPGDGTGTPWEAALVNDIFGFQQRLLSDAGITPTGNPEKVSASQYMDSMETVFPRVFDTYDTELAAYTPLADEQIVYCKGKSSVGDGGAGYYQYDLASTTWVLLSIATNSKLEYKNKILNGDFDLWDYPSTTQTASGYGSDNRWSNGHSGSTKTHSRQVFTVGQTDVPDNPGYYSRTVFTTASGTGDYVRKQHKIEFVKTFSGETVTLSFYAKAGSALNIATEFVQYFGTGGSPSTRVTTIGVNTYTLTTSWQKFTATVAIPSISGKTLGTTIDDYLGLIIWFEAGSDYNSRTNSLGNQSGTVDISHVQVEQGPIATKFEQPFIQDLKAECMRYYFRAKSSASVRCNLAAGRIQTPTVASYSFVYPVEMRAIPSITFDAATAYDLGDGGGIQNSTAMSVSEPTEQSVLILGSSTGFANVGGGSNLRIKTSHYIEFDAEL